MPYTFIKCNKTKILGKHCISGIQKVHYCSLLRPVDSTWLITLFWRTEKVFLNPILSEFFRWTMMICPSKMLIRKIFWGKCQNVTQFLFNKSVLKKYKTYTFVKYEEIIVYVVPLYGAKLIAGGVGGQGWANLSP